MRFVRWISCISIHALREEGDERIMTILNEFYNFYPRPPRGGRQCHKMRMTLIRIISIHALREEGDLLLSVWQHLKFRISIHALREEGDRMAGCC